MRTCSLLAEKRVYSFDQNELENNCKSLRIGLKISYNEGISCGKVFKADMTILIMK